MKPRYEQLQRMLQNDKDAGGTPYRFPPEELKTIKWEIKVRSKGKIPPSAIDRIMAIAADIVGAFIPCIPGKPNKPATTTQDIKTLQHLVGLLQDAVMDMNNLTTQGMVGLQVDITFPNGTPSPFSKSDIEAISKVDPVSSIEALTEAVRTCIGKLETFNDEPTLDFHRKAIAELRFYFTNQLAIAWEEIMGKEPASSMKGPFNYFLQQAYGAVGLPVTKDNRKIILQTRQRPK